MPDGFAGSITHKGPLTFAVATGSSQGIGVDVECTEDSDGKLLKRVLVAAERSVLDPSDDVRAAITIVAHFAAKEAIYKALTPELQPNIDFEDIELRLPPYGTLSRGRWETTPARLIVLTTPIRLALLLDGNWALAVATYG